MRILVASAALVALASPPAQAGPLFKLFHSCHFAFQTQCAVNLTKGHHNKARIDQDQWGYGFQFGLTVQHGNDNTANTFQTGTNQVAVTVQDGNNNSAYTSQNGQGQVSTTVEHGSGMWSVTTVSEDNTETHAIGSN